MFLFKDALEFTLFGKDLSIQYYALTMIFGAFVAYYVARTLIQKLYKKGDLIDNIFVPCFLSGVIGGRIWFVLSELEYYSEYPSEIYKVWHGGLAIQGGVLLGTIVGVALICLDYKKTKQEGGMLKYVLKMADIILPSVLIAQCIGRWGNFFNVEVYGECVDKSKLAFLPNFIMKRLIYDTNGLSLCPINQAVQPLFLYEGILTLLGFILILFVIRKVWKNTRETGTLAFLYPIYYGIVRFILEPLREEEYIMRWGKYSQTAITSIAYIVIGVAGLVWLYFPKIKKMFSKKEKGSNE